MIDSGDGDLLHQKLTMSQYIAFKSEPLGTLGESPSLGQRVKDNLCFTYLLVFSCLLFIFLFFFT